MDAAPSHIIAWVGTQILPHEADVRAWLRRARVHEADVEDILQESYCRMTALTSVDHIASPRAYFFTVAKNVTFMRLRRARVVRIEAVEEIDRLDVISESPTPEQFVSGRTELARLYRLIKTLPARCRKVFVMRRVQNIPQKEIARRLGLTETTVENEAAKGLRLILSAIAAEDRGVQPHKVRGAKADVHRR
jgi:RNA polymerase sigma-70 factor (ECF subfamily)